ncbi:MAG: bifunctional phosphoribosyl-AMP cyclohydrolase/phosphoribosyl-ATP diphosphatase, partial [Acidobacteria bacterium]
MSLVSIVADCDNDALSVAATPASPTCHIGQYSCFGPEPPGGIAGLWNTIRQRLVERPEGSYTASLVDGGTDAVARKVVEEAS